MCGIFGAINTNEKIDEGRVLAARDTLAYRGPDDSGLYITCTHASLHPNVFLAHRRLSIIDLSPAAHQPMFEKITKFKDLKIPRLGEENNEGLASNNQNPASSPDMIGMSQSRHIQDQESRYVIVYNGEIYNFKELIPRLTFDVSHLTSSSDTEVILNLYAQYGKDCLNMLRGMFAFAIWDDKEKTLFAARDRFGIKPFYYLKNNWEFIFSSEIKAIKHYKKNLTLSMEGVDAFLRTGSVPAPLTIYNEVSSLMPGHYLTIKPFDTSTPLSMTMKEGEYWNFNDLFENSLQSAVGSEKDAKGNKAMDSRLSADKADVHGNDKQNVILTKACLTARQVGIHSANKLYDSDAKENPSNHAGMQAFTHALRYDDDAKNIIRTALLDSVRAHLVSDVEVGAFLSGGIDSTAIVSLMRQLGQEKIKTVSVVFPGNKLDESKYALLAAKTYNTEHIEVPFFEQNLIDDFDNIMASMDQPTIDGINTYFVSKAAKQAGLKVVLSGLGGDELFGGYPSFNLIPKYQRIKNLPFAKMFMKAAAPLLKNKLPAKAIEYFQNPNAQNAEYKLIRGLFTDDELRIMGWSHAAMHSYSHAANDEHDRMNERLHEKQYISYLETSCYMRNQLLRDSDVFSMAHSLELRVPFVDHLLYAAVLPYLDDSYDKNFPKKMMVEAVGDIPDEIIHRPKFGFTFPFEDWLRTGKLNSICKELIFGGNLQQYIDKKSLIELFDKFEHGKLQWSRIWALMILSKFI